MSLGLSHSLSRHKLKFSPDKVDTMIVQAIALLDDLDKELNTYAMRVKEWYGWHFPEMGRIVNDNLAYARVILSMGMRTEAVNADLAEILPEEIETAVKAAAEVSMGSEITSDDLDNIQSLAQQVVDFTEYRQQLSSYLSARMAAIAPNLTALVGDLVGARLIAHAGSLMNLAKAPGSTIQILGAEKALFRALKTKHDTPKYGLIYHASLIGQATGKNKGAIARMLASKVALGLRVDALSDWGAEGEGKGDDVAEEEKSMMGNNARLKIEKRLASLEGRPLRGKGVAIAPNGVSVQPGKWEVKEARKYNPDADGLVGNEPAAITAVPEEPAAKKPMEEIPDVKMIEEIEESEEGVEEGEEDEEEGDEDVDTEEEEERRYDALMQGRATRDLSADYEYHDNNLPKAVPSNSLPPASAGPEGVNGTSSTSKPGLSVMIDTKPKDKGNDDDKSETISTVSNDTPDSPDSPTQQELNWQSSILGNTKEAKKKRKEERHLRKLALSEERSAKKRKVREKLARRLDRKERRQKRAEQLERREAREYEGIKVLALKAGLTTTRYKRKLERGEIKFDEDGTPRAISKKEIKKAKKAAEKAEKGTTANGEDESSGKKRKREEDGGEVAGKSEKKKKKNKV